MHSSAFVFFLLLLICISSVYSEDHFPENLTDSGEIGMARKKRRGANKYVIPLLFGALLIKSIIFPFVFKAMGVMTTVSVLLSSMSLIISSIIGYVKLAVRSHIPSVRIVQRHPHHWAKDDDYSVKNYYPPLQNHDPVLAAPSEQQYTGL